MTVDVGPRQSGKTTRLIDSVVEFLENNQDKSALIVAPLGDMRRLIVDKVKDRCGFCTERVITSYKMLPPTRNSTIKQFVDEFSFLSDENLQIDFDAHYNGTLETSLMSTKKRLILEYYKKENIKPKKVLPRHGL